VAYDGGTTALGAVRPSSILGTPTNQNLAIFWSAGHQGMGSSITEE